MSNQAMVQKSKGARGRKCKGKSKRTPSGNMSIPCHFFIRNHHAPAPHCPAHGGVQIASLLPDMPSRNSKAHSAAATPSTSDYRMLWLPMVVLALIAFALYANTLGNGFVDDDEAQVLQNPWIRSFRFVPDIFGKSVWSFLAEQSISNYYRPMMHLIYLLNFHLFGLKPWGFHLVNVLFHAANVVLVFHVASRLFTMSGVRMGSVWFAPPFLAALLFATHPIHTEAVDWIASIPELSFTFFFLVAFALHISKEGLSPARVMLSACAYFVSLLCKETALMLLPVLLLFEIVFHRSLTQRFRSYVPHFGATGVYLWVRYQVLYHTFLPITAFHEKQLTTYQLIINIPPLIYEYIRSCVIPGPLNFWHFFRPISSVMSIAALPGLLAAAFLVAAGVFSWRKNRMDFFWIFLFLAPLIPAFYIKTLPGKPFAERYLYLPSVGFVVLLAMGLSSLIQKKTSAGITLVVAITLLYSGVAFERNRDWKDAVTLFQDTVQKSPEATIPRYDLAIAFYRSGKVDAALEHLTILVKSTPSEAKFRSAYGAALLQKDRLDEAIQELNTAISLDPKSLETYNDLAVALHRKGQSSEAIAVYRKALSIDPEYPEANFNLAAALADEGQMDEAINHYESAVRFAPENDYYHNALGIEYAKLGRMQQALVQFQAALNLNPSEPAYQRNVNRASGMMSH